MRLHAAKQLQRKRTQMLAAALRNRDEVELILKTPEGAQENVAKALRSLGEVTHVYKRVPYLSIRTESRDALLMKQGVEQLADNLFRQNFSYAARNIRNIEVAATLRIPQPKKASDRIWNLERIGAYEAQAVADGSGVKVALIDTGVDYTHHELAGCFGSEKGYDFVERSKDPMDQNGHGTHVAGIAAGKRYGVAPGATLYSLRVLDASGSGSEADAMAAIEWALDKKLDVANMSLGSPFASAALEDLCYVAAAEGLLLVAAAGNSGSGPAYPAAFGDPVIAVAATDQLDRHPSFSNIYYTNDVSAPGVDIISSIPGGYGSLTGTSMAAPHVTGALALVASVSSRDLEKLMKETAEPLGDADKFGTGMVRVDKMLEQGKGLGVRQYGGRIAGRLRQLVW